MALVVIFHLAPAVLPGGYIGVDVFFVISGFLITSHLVREVDRSGTIKLSEFWARRIRRLLPAAFLVLVVSAIAVLVFLPAATQKENLLGIFFAGVYGVNWYLAANSVDYLGADTSASIAQHYWSLSVEEQFYIVWPLLLLAAVWLARKALRISPRTMIAIVLAVVFAASLLWSIVETARSQPSAYFITTTRAWEFAAGGLIGMLPALRMPERGRVLTSWAATLAVIGSAFLFDAKTAFPGWIALIPVAAAAWLLHVGDVPSTSSPQYLARAGWVQRIGDLSYSIYLWHWPLIIVFVAVRGTHPGWKTMIVLAAITIVLAALTKRYVEDPVRRAPGLLRRRVPTYAAMLVGAGLVTALTIVPGIVKDRLQEQELGTVAAYVADESSCFGAYAIENGCDPKDVPTGLIDPAVSIEDSFAATLSKEHCEQTTVEGEVVIHCSYPGGKGAMALFGDSHASHIITPLQKLAAERGQRLDVDTRTGCSGFPTPGTAQSENARLCAEWSEATLSRIVADPSITDVVVSIRTILTAGDTDVAAAQLARLKDAGKHVYVFRAVPGMADKWPIDFTDRAETAPRCVERGGNCDWVPAPWDDWLLDAAARADVPVLDSWQIVCPDGVCKAVIGGTIVYFDESHLTDTFSSTMTPWFRKQIAQ